MAQERLVVNMRVLARYHGAGDYFAGTVTKVHADGTYEVLFQRGEKDDDVLRKDIKVWFHADVLDRMPSRCVMVIVLANHAPQKRNPGQT